MATRTEFSISSMQSKESDRWFDLIQSHHWKVMCRACENKQPVNNQQNNHSEKHKLRHHHHAMVRWTDCTRTECANSSTQSKEPDSWFGNFQTSYWAHVKASWLEHFTQIHGAALQGCELFHRENRWEVRDLIIRQNSGHDERRWNINNINKNSNSAWVVGCP